MNPPLIRPALDSDGDAIAALIAGAFAEYEGCVFDRVAEFPELDAIARHFAARGGTIWVAQDKAGDGAAIIGSLAATPMRAEGVPAGTLEITKVYVARAARRRGVARALMGEALALAGRLGAPELRLWTDTRFLDAHRFYESLGFERLPGARALGDLSDTSEYPYRLPLAGE
ncbi:GNAT family N-acetyltransferase [Ancylobacter sp. Lp-2]|uniref:GNAT family N-acetyltransferase n=1 Tax=Ancylobacter sp. Lp-2 TaxID=2881339 RepID=UPI001E46E776|nr:GNAT family N-acetyltransferase [Ancylobacter sp. Lp-2]MCB4771436.1 GNAT family N-acetyltransferase [Ancylobacter sp. Lp-2]